MHPLEGERATLKGHDIEGLQGAWSALRSSWTEIGLNPAVTRHLTLAGPASILVRKMVSGGGSS
jgi:hypothetical protein